MAKPRIFISSTFFDLRQIREEIERFIKELGYEPVRHETGAVPYGKSEALENYAYGEVGLCDIIVNVIGGRYGTESVTDPGHSITQNELRRALEGGIQVFVFVESSVLSEFATFQLNKETKDIKYRFVDDMRIYDFLERIYQLPNNNPITGFQTGKEITEFLRIQFAGLFQRFLKEQARRSEVKVLEDIKAVAGTLHQLVEFLTKSGENRDEAIQTILLASHPAFRAFAKVTDANYRVFFTTVTELNQWLAARTWKPVEKENFDLGSVYEWVRQEKYIKLTRELFDKDGRLMNIKEEDWDDLWLQKHDLPDESDDVGAPPITLQKPTPLRRARRIG